MQVIKDIQQWRDIRNNLPNALKLGAVPTMGNLHQGHAALIARSIKENDLTVVTIFINPTQFNNSADYEKYPQTLKQDFELLENLKIDYCLTPSRQELYPDDFSYQITENSLSTLMEGKSRPGHFSGMLTIVLKLLLLLKPRNAYFGEKDFQQLQLIQGLVKSFFLECNIIACPTIREPSRLAFSSRNNRLNPQQRLLAEKFAEIFHDGKHCESIKNKLQDLGITVDYIEEYLQRRFAAVFIDEIRLIDNYGISNFDYRAQIV